jgi:hypothetical protein
LKKKMQKFKDKRMAPPVYPPKPRGENAFSSKVKFTNRHLKTYFFIL